MDGTQRFSAPAPAGSKLHAALLKAQALFWHEPASWAERWPPITCTTVRQLRQNKQELLCGRVCCHRGIAAAVGSYRLCQTLSKASW